VSDRSFQRQTEALAATANAFLRSGDMLGEAASRFGLGVALEGADQHDHAAREFLRAAALRSQCDQAADAAEAQLAAGIALAAAARLDESVSCFAAAAALLDASSATQMSHRPAVDSRLRLRVDACWLDALVELAGSGLPASDLVDAMLLRCNRLLSLTHAAADPEAQSIRFRACYQKARLLTLREDVVAALPCALEAADCAAAPNWPADPSVDRAAIEEQMRFTTSGAYMELDDLDAAEPQLIRLAELADARDDRRSSSLALRQLAARLRDDPNRAATRFTRLAASYQATGARHSEAVARSAHARALQLRRGSDLDRDVRVSEEFQRAAELFDGSGEVGSAADAYLSAARARSDVALLRPEHRDDAARLFEKAADGFAEAGQWWARGLALYGESELLNRWYDGVERDDRRVDDLLLEALACFDKAERPGEAADVRVQLAANEGLRSGATDQWLERSLEALRGYGPARTSRVLPIDREFHERLASSGFAVIGSTACDYHPDRMQSDARWSELVWGLEQVTKARSLQDQLNEPAVWQRFLASDGLLRCLTREVEEAEFRVAAILRERDVTLAAVAADARAALKRAIHHQRQRLYAIEPHAAESLSLASSPHVELRTLQRVLRPAELYVGFLMLHDDRILRTQVTSHAVRFDALDAPDVGYLLLKQQHAGELGDVEKQSLHRTVAGLLGIPPSGIDTVIVCPDRQLVAVPWHLLPAPGGGFLGDVVTTAMVPAAGAFVQQRQECEPSGASAAEHLSYLGVADSHGDPRSILMSVDWEVENVRASYFDVSGRSWLTGETHRLLDANAHVELLHLACHASVAGLMFTNRIVTPMDLADMRLSADILLLTGCETAAFAHDESNEFFGIVRQLLVSTRAKAAVVSLRPVVDDSGPLFCELVVSALTGRAIDRPWTITSGPRAIGDAVRWARMQMRQLTEDEAQPFVPNKRVEPTPGDPDWWSPWCLVGDPKAAMGMVLR
jgi:hypothetical protein